MKFLLIKIVYIVLPLILFISSCTTDNLVLNIPIDPGPDTASYYTWEKFESNANFGDVFVNDTNNIWIATVNGPVVFNGSTFTYLERPSGFFMSSLAVVNKNVSFWGGSIGPIGAKKSALIKYENGGSSIYLIDTSLGGYPVTSILALNENQVWIGINPSQYAYFFDNGKITKHYIGFHFSPQFKKWNNSIYCFASTYYDSSSTMTTFKFNGSMFDSIRIEQTAFKGDQGITEHIYNCGDDLINLNSQFGTYYLTETGWVQNNVLMGGGFYGAWKVGGTSKDSLSFFSSYPYDMYNWNGIRFRKQNSFSGFIGYWGLFSYYSNIVNYKGRLYFTVNIQEGISSYSYLIVGKPKN